MLIQYRLSKSYPPILCLRLKIFRGCVTSGQRWVFFIYNAERGGPGGKKVVHWFEPLPLGERHNQTLNLELILGILRDWVSPAFENHLVLFLTSSPLG